MILNCSQNNSLSFQAIDRIIDKKELTQLIPYSEVQIQRLEQKGLFPKRIKIGANRVGWSLNEINEWIEALT
jgi:prophage regulatory protein